MNKVYIIWNNSCKHGDICANSDIDYISRNYYLALDKFKKYEKLCKDTYNDPKWYYSYSLVVYDVDTFPVKSECLFEVDNLPNEETSTFY